MGAMKQHMISQLPSDADVARAMTTVHPDYLLAFTLRLENGAVRCDHCGEPYPCAAALGLHDCDASELCRAGDCGLRRGYHSA